MAQFCTKCGSPLVEGMRFCTGCGAALEGPPAPASQPPAAQAPPPPEPPPAVATPAPPPTPVPATPTPAAAAPAASGPAPVSTAAKPGSPLLKIVVAVVAVLLVFGIIGAGACVYYAYRFKQRMNQYRPQARITAPMPTGTREIQPQSNPVPTPETAAPMVTEVATYPGATAVEGGGEMSMGGGAVKVQQFVTDDSVDKVVSFYKDKLGPKSMVQQTGDQVLVQLAGSNGVISITITRDATSGKTKFSITRIGK